MVESFRIEIPGEFSDVWLSMGRLLLLDRRGGARVVDQKSIRRLIAQQSGADLATVADYLFFRNDWKKTPQFTAMMNISAVAREFWRPLDLTSFVVVPDIESRDVLNVFEGFVLDTELYLGNLFVGTTRGLFQSRFVPKNRRLTSSEQAIDQRVGKLSVGLNSVNASLGDEGLYFSRLGDIDVERPPDTEFRQISDLSISSAFSERTLVNLRDPETLELFVGVVELEDRSQRLGETAREAEAVESFSRLGLSAARNWKAGSSTRSFADLEHDLILTDASDGSQVAIQMKNFADSGPITLEPHSSRTLFVGSRVGRPVLTTLLFGEGVVAETFDAVFYVDDSEVYALWAGKAARVRTFPQSDRHRDVVAIVADDAVHLVATYERDRDLIG